MNDSEESEGYFVLNIRFFATTGKILEIQLYKSSGPPIFVSSPFMGNEVFIRISPLEVGLYVLCVARPTWSMRDRVGNSSPRDATRVGKLGADTHEVCVDLAGCLTTFVDAPNKRVSKRQENDALNELTRQ